MEKEGERIPESSGFYYTCLRRVVGECPHCERNYDYHKPPTNDQCPYHLGISLNIFDVKETSNSKLEKRIT